MISTRIDQLDFTENEYEIATRYSKCKINTRMCESMLVSALYNYHVTTNEKVALNTLEIFHSS